MPVDFFDDIQPGTQFDAAGNVIKGGYVPGSYSASMGSSGSSSLASAVGNDPRLEGKRGQINLDFDISRRRDQETNAQQSAGLDQRLQARGMSQSGIFGKETSGLAKGQQQDLNDLERQRAIALALAQGMQSQQSAGAGAHTFSNYGMTKDGQQVPTGNSAGQGGMGIQYGASYNPAMGGIGRAGMVPEGTTMSAEEAALRDYMAQNGFDITQPYPEQYNFQDRGPYSTT
jgi:hypothetical protein